MLLRFRTGSELTKPSSCPLVILLGSRISRLRVSSFFPSFLPSLIFSSPLGWRDLSPTLLPPLCHCPLVIPRRLATCARVQPYMCSRSNVRYTRYWPAARLYATNPIDVCPIHRRAALQPSWSLITRGGRYSFLPF